MHIKFVPFYYVIWKIRIFEWICSAIKSCNILNWLYSCCVYIYSCFVASYWIEILVIQFFLKNDFLNHNLNLREFKPIMALVIARAALYWILSIFGLSFYCLVDHKEMEEVCGWNNLIFFLEKRTSWACIFRTGSNDIFHWCAHSAIFWKSLFNLYVIVLASSIVVSSDVLSVNNSTVDTI